MLVRSTTPGPLKILIVDVTRNANGFEHEVSSHMTAELIQRGVPVTDNSPALVDDEMQFSNAFSSAGSFSVALLVAHGAEDLGGDEASQLAGPGSADEWFSTAALTEQMQDKLLLLCVCHGYSPDPIDAFVRDTSIVLSIVAPTSALEASEAEAFFPNFLEALQPTSAIEIDPTVVEEKLEQTNHYSGGKMKLFSQGLPS
jgi:hypothetical protein